jgi:hypothetical protein
MHSKYYLNITFIEENLEKSSGIEGVDVMMGGINFQLSNSKGFTRRHIPYVRDCEISALYSLQSFAIPDQAIFLGGVILTSIIR